MVKQLLGLDRLPDVPMISWALSSIDGLNVERMRALCRNLFKKDDDLSNHSGF